MFHFHKVSSQRGIAEKKTGQKGISMDSNPRLLDHEVCASHAAHISRNLGQCNNTDSVKKWKLEGWESLIFLKIDALKFHYF